MRAERFRANSDERHEFSWKVVGNAGLVDSSCWRVPISTLLCREDVESLPQADQADVCDRSLRCAPDHGVSSYRPL